MRTITIKHDFYSKLSWIITLCVWILTLLIFIYGFTMSLYYSFMLKGDWRTGPYLFLTLLTMLVVYFYGYMVYQFRFVWKLIYIEGNYIIQENKNKKNIIDISDKFNVEYVFLSIRTPKLKVPRYQFVELQQGDSVIRLLPLRTNLKDVLMDVPKEIQNLWYEYERRRGSWLLW